MSLWSLLTSLVLVWVFQGWKVNFPSLEKLLSYKGANGFGRYLPLLTFGAERFLLECLPRSYDW